MSRLGCVTLSEALDVTARKACFLSLLAQAAVWLLELRMDHPRLLCATEQVARFALPSRFRASGSKERGGNDAGVSEQSQLFGCLSLPD